MGILRARHGRRKGSLKVCWLPLNFVLLAVDLEGRGAFSGVGLDLNLARAFRTCRNLPNRLMYRVLLAVSRFVGSFEFPLIGALLEL